MHAGLLAAAHAAVVVCVLCMSMCTTAQPTTIGLAMGLGPAMCDMLLLQVMRTVTHDKQTGHELAVNEFTTFVLGTGALTPRQPGGALIELLIRPVCKCNGTPPEALNAQSTGYAAACIPPAFHLCLAYRSLSGCEVPAAAQPCRHRSQHTTQQAARRSA